MKSSFTIHLLQWRVVPGEVEENLHKAGILVGRAGPGGGDIVLLPEMFPSGFYYENLGKMASKADHVLGWMAELAGNRGIHVAGSMAMGRPGGIANCLTVVDPKGQVAASYDKIHLFPVTGEHRHFVAGNETASADIGGADVGLAICFDLRYPEMTKRLCQKGALMTLVSAQWPVDRIRHFVDLVRVRALENLMFVAACNSCGDNGKGLVMGGRSLVVDPWGETVGILGEEEGVLSVAVDLDRVARIREKFPVLEYRRTDIFGEG